VADKQNFRQGNPILFVVLVTGGAPERLLSSDFTGHGRCILDSPEMPIPPLEVFVFAPLIVLTAYVIFGISGFGSTLIAVPLLAHLFPLKFVIPMMVILDCIGSISMGFRLRADVNRHELVPLLPFMLTGMIAGVFVLLSVPGGVLLGVLGVLVLAYGLLYISRKDAIVRFARWSAKVETSCCASWRRWTTNPARARQSRKRGPRYSRRAICRPSPQHPVLPRWCSGS